MSNSPNTPQIEKKQSTGKMKMSNHKTFKLGSRPELNNANLFGKMLIRNSFMHKYYEPELDSSHSFQFYSYLSQNSPEDKG